MERDCMFCRKPWGELKSHHVVLSSKSKLLAKTQLRLRSIIHCLLGFCEGDVICLSCKIIIQKLADKLPDVEGIPALAVEVEAALGESELRQVTIQRATNKTKLDYFRVHPSWIPLVKAACLMDPKKLAKELTGYQEQHVEAMKIVADVSGKFDEVTRARAEEETNFVKPVLDAMVAAVSSMVLGEVISMCSDIPKTPWRTRKAEDILSIGCKALQSELYASYMKNMPTFLNLWKLPTVDDAGPSRGRRSGSSPCWAP
jgi:hypothetical protein